MRAYSRYNLRRTEKNSHGDGKICAFYGGVLHNEESCNNRKLPPYRRRFRRDIFEGVQYALRSEEAFTLWDTVFQEPCVSVWRAGISNEAGLGSSVMVHSLL